MHLTSKYKVLQGVERLLAQEKARFVVIGGIGFAVNFLGLTLFFDTLHLPIAVAQVISVELAVLATFAGNNGWAFKGHDNIPLIRKLWRYHASSIVGMLLNSVITIALVDIAGLYYGLALIIGAIIGLLWNYTAYRRFVFMTHKNKQDSAQ
jgi:putative flippase GtrA